MYVVNNHGDQQYHLIKNGTGSSGSSSTCFCKRGWLCPPCSGSCMPDAPPSHTSQERKVYWDVFRNLWYEWLCFRVLTHLKTWMFRVLLADLPFKKFLLEDPTTLLNFINLLVQTLQSVSLTAGSSCCYIDVFQQSANPKKTHGNYIFQLFERTTKCSHLLKCVTPSPLALAAMTTEPLA